MKKIFFFLFFIFFLFNSYAFGGQIIIKTIDFKTKQPIVKTFIRLTSIYYKNYKIEDETNSHGIASIDLNDLDNWKNSNPSATILAMKHGYYNKLLPLYNFDLYGHY